MQPLLLPGIVDDVKKDAGRSDDDDDDDNGAKVAADEGSVIVCERGAGLKATVCSSASIRFIVVVAVNADGVVAEAAAKAANVGVSIWPRFVFSIDFTENDDSDGLVEPECSKSLSSTL